MFAAYVAAGALGAGPSVAKRRRSLGPEVARAHLAPAVEAAWAAIQVFVAVVTLACAVAPATVLALPLLGLPAASAATLYAGTALFAAGAATTGWAARSLGRHLTTAIEVRAGDELVTRGPYSRVRHPVYTGIFAMTGGLALALFDPFAFGVFLMAIAIGNHRATKEEELLARDTTHGQAYEAYRRRTGRFLVRLR
ncbi:MAG TPA: isoprenylcysteine carboxylmethyltransferase family protein [Candidatus Thermoplasmatota archaeon]